MLSSINYKYLDYYACLIRFNSQYLHNQRMITKNCESQRINQNSCSDRLASNKLKDNMLNSEILCKITFDLDEESQELFVYEDTQLNELTENLVEKLKKSCLAYDQNEYQITDEDKKYFKEQIKARIQNIMDQNIEKSLQAAKWRNKLRQILQERVRTPMDSLISPNSQRQTPTESKSVSYFKYNFPQSHNDQLYKQRQMIERMKILDKQINKQTKTKDEKKNRLYDLGKQTNLLKDYISKIHVYETQQEELSECTFHPFVKKHHEIKENGSFHHQSEDVFKRLYNQAIQKKEKMKKIQVEVQNRQTEEYKHLNFIPQINQCSKEIIRAKKEQKTSVYEALYKDVLLKDQKKKFQPQCTFHPTISSKSNKIFKNSERNKGNQKTEGYSSKRFFNDSNSKRNQLLSQIQRQGLKTENSRQKSPIFQKNISNNKPEYNIIHQSSQACIKPIRNQQDTLKKTYYKPNVFHQSQSTLKQNIFSKKAFKKPNKNKNEANQNSKQSNLYKANSYYVQPKDIKRQKVIISETYQTCNTEQTNPIFNISSCNTFMSLQDDTKNRKTKQKSNNRLNPFTFFEQKQKEKKINSIYNKQNVNIMKDKKQQDKNFQLEFSKRKTKIFQEIFEFLLQQSNDQNEISYNAITDSKIIPSSLKHIFYPMAEQMKQLNVGLDKQQFIWSMARIFDSLTLQERGWILAWGLKLQEPNIEKMKNIR